MEMIGIQMRQAAVNADTLIVRTAMDLSPTIDAVVVGLDLDNIMLIVLLQFSSSDNHLYLFKPSSGKYSNNVYNIRDINNIMRGISMQWQAVIPLQRYSDKVRRGHST